jgi:hypothetical protein
MSSADAWASGWRRVRRAWVVALGAWLATIAIALPLALLLRTQIRAHLGASAAADVAATGVNFDWWNEFAAGATGLGQTFVPAVIGFAAVLQNLSGMADGPSYPGLIMVAIAAQLVVSVFLMGGILDRLARDRAIGSVGFFGACGVYVVRFLRLAVVAAVTYWALFSWLRPLLLDSAYGTWTREATDERVAFAVRAVLYVVFGIALMAVNLIFDYAKVRMVVEDRRSAIGAIAASLRFIRRHPSAVAALAILNGLAFATLLAAYSVTAPGAAASPWLTVVVGQVFIIGRVAARLAAAASQIAFFQGRLAHAGYTAAPVPAWPDSPAVEAIRR